MGNCIHVCGVLFVGCLVKGCCVVNVNVCFLPKIAFAHVPSPGKKNTKTTTKKLIFFSFNWSGVDVAAQA